MLASHTQCLNLLWSGMWTSLHYYLFTSQNLQVITHLLAFILCPVYKQYCVFDDWGEITYRYPSNPSTCSPMPRKYTPWAMPKSGAMTSARHVAPLRNAAGPSRFKMRLQKTEDVFLYIIYCNSIYIKILLYGWITIFKFIIYLIHCIKTLTACSQWCLCMSPPPLPSVGSVYVSL